MIRQRAALDRIPVYKQGAAPSGDLVKLSSNENPYPPLDSVLDVVRAEAANINRYPEIAASELRARLARLHGVDADHICLGAGSVEVATQLVQASAGEGDEVLFAWRSFEAYPIISTAAGATAVTVPLAADETHDLVAMAEAVTERTRIILLCTPNNPTGATLAADRVDAFLDRVPSDVLVVIDEAYEHFNRDPASVRGIEVFASRPNVAVLRTFSKAYGLAGLRIGYAVAPREVADNLRKVAVPFAVSALAQRAAIASLDAEAELEARIERIVAERSRVERAIAEAGWRIHPSHANFVWLRAGEGTDALVATLLEHRVVARPFAGEGVRVTIGEPHENDRVIDAVRAHLHH